MHAINRSMGAVEWSLLITLSVLWGGSFFFVSVAVDGLPPFTIVALRVGLAAVILNVVIVATGLRMPMDRRSWQAFFGMGFINNLIPFSLIVWGQTHIAGGLASILNATTPLFSIVVAHWLTADEKMTPGRIAGIVLGIAGVAIVIGPGVLQGIGTNVLAQLAILAASLSYAFGAVFGRRFRAMGIKPHVTAAGQVTASTMMLLPLALLVDRPWSLAAPGIEVWGAVLGLAVLSTAFAYIIYFRILASSGATNILLVTLLIPVSAILLGVFVLGEELLLRHFLGMLVIALGLAAIDGRLLGRFRGADGNHPLPAQVLPGVQAHEPQQTAHPRRKED